MNCEWKQEALEILEDGSASNWLKEAIKSLAKRDPVDAANDAETLKAIMDMRANDALGHAFVKAAMKVSK